ncbi:Bcr/CflA family drug resistance efflux transporter [Advenella faeciporci]|uniref:Bcr/CflA family efflux transporter n=1 Tax=Advenella faeciporci TaxID=797535 RepID=A0A918JGW3_9BURK|nr:multidrug effflux MFS transporter [Advenella faeciporci]GGW76502.1 Bcr/CflA family drug resistance efflux transporter [Advenella faeciporci]
MQKESLGNKIPFWLILMALITALGPITIDMYLPTFPAIAQDLQVSPHQIELTVSSYLLGLSMAQLFIGPITDRYGRKKPLLFGLGLYLLATISCALSTSFEMLLVARTLQAFGAASCIVIPRAVIRDHYNTQDAAHALSLLMLIMGLAPVLAPVAGSFLGPIVGWRGLFAIMLLIAVLLIALCVVKLQESLKPEKVVKLSAKTIGGNYFGLLCHRNFMAFALSGGLGMAGLFAFIASSPTIFITQFGIAPENFGFLFGLNAAGLILGSQISVHMLRKHASIKVLKTALLLGLVSSVTGLLLTLGNLINLTLFMICMFCLSACLGVINPNSTALALKEQGTRLGVASALMGCMQFMFGTLTSSLVSNWQTGTALPLFTCLFVCIGISFICGRYIGRA